MNDFIFYFVEGWKHIISTNALDHQLFIIALAIIYSFKEWKKVLILVTAFTLGHSLTLALSVLDIFRLPSAITEFLIPLTIVFTTLWNIFFFTKNKITHSNYWLALFFGLIHGMGFANSIRLMLASDQSIVTGLLGFNVGLEAGQILVVLLVLVLINILTITLKLKRKVYIIPVSVIILLLSAKMCIDRLPAIF
ncbi:MAG: HupE/UreJ family protein [Niabella sp.]